MKYLENPILTFRGTSQLNSSVSRKTFDIRLGLRLTKDNKILIESDENIKEHLATLITETREAVDSSENS